MAESDVSRWRNGVGGGERDLSLDLTLDGGDFLGSSEDSTGLNSFHTAKSWHSNQGYNSHTTISSDLVPNVTIILPPCSSVGENVAVDVHIEHPVSTDGNYNLVCVMKGLHIARVALSPSDGLSVRVHIPQLAAGVVDIFVLKSSLSASTYAGEPGHLLVLPEAQARDANAMFTQLVSVALQDSVVTQTATICEEQETVVHRSRSCEDLCGSASQALRTEGFPQATEDIPEPSAFAGGFDNQDRPSGTSGMTIELPASLRIISPLMASFRVLNVQKWIWSKHFTPFALELQALLLAVGVQSHDPGNASIGPSTNYATALQLGPVFVEVLENILLHLKKFDAWELISFVLKKSIEAGVAIFWEGKRLNGELLTGQRLKDLARDSEAGAAVRDHSIPGPSGLGGYAREDAEIKSKERCLFGSTPTHQRDTPGITGTNEWSRARTLNTRAGSQDVEKKSKGRLYRLIRRLSKSIHHNTQSERAAGSLTDAQDDNPPTIESGQLLNVNPREDSASRRRSQPIRRQSRRRSKAWESIRRRFFKTDSANTQTDVTPDSGLRRAIDGKGTWRGE